MVSGAAGDALEYCKKQVEIELNGVGDNPIFIVDDDAYLDLTEQTSTLAAFGAANVYGFRIKYDGGDKYLHFESGYTTTKTDRTIEVHPKIA